MNDQSGNGRRPRYRMYVDESGDHTYQSLHHLSRRYLGLTGVTVASDYYREVLHPDFLAFRQQHFPHSPDEPVILHRADIVNRRGPFTCLTDPNARSAYDRALEVFLRQHDFSVVTVVIDKFEHVRRYVDPWHPYHYCLTVLVERYRGFLAARGGIGDVMAESRGGTEDRQLKQAYSHVYSSGTLHLRPPQLAAFLSSKEIKLEKKGADICGLQIADLLAHQCKHAILAQRALLPAPPGPFGTRVWQAVEDKCDVRYGRILLC